MSLMFGPEANLVSFSEVAAVETPPNTGTHYPVSHDKFVGSIRHCLREEGLRVEQEAFVLAREGARLYGTMRLSQAQPLDHGITPVILPKPDWGLCLGFRNAHDKACSAGLILGNYVSVCDNGMFVGDVRVGRKHTRWIERDLVGLMREALGKVVVASHTQERRVSCYQGHGLSKSEAHDLIISAYDADVIPSSKIGQVIDEWRHPAHPEFKDRTCWSMQNCFTEVLKGYQPSDHMSRTMRLTSVLDQFAGFVAA